MVYKWKRDQIEKLIDSVRQYNCIYNIKTREYLDRAKKAEAFNNIVEELREKDSAITLDEVKRKWKNLRIQYTQELRAIINSRKNGAATEDFYVPKLWCFDQLDFLRTHSEVRAGKDTIEVYIDDGKAHTSSESQNENSNVEPKRKKQKQVRAVNEFRNELDNFTAVISKIKKEKPYGWLGALVVYEMERISPDDQPDAAWQVQCLMHKLTSQSFRKRSYSSTSSSIKDILEQTMEVFDE